MQPRPEVRAQWITTVAGERDARGLAVLVPARRSRVARVATAAVALTALAWVGPAQAQVGLGAERYEVTITPPKRPGSETPPAETAPTAPAAPTANETLGALDAPAAGAAAAPADANTAPEAKAGAVAPGADAASATARSGATAAQPPGSTAAQPPASARATANLPQRTLQVGAYRQHKRALEMRDKLAASFQDVAIVEVQSGGEALYRVNVGRMPRGAGLDDLRRRVIAAGYPAFEVPAPTVPVGD